MLPLTTSSWANPAGRAVGDGSHRLSGLVKTVIYREITVTYGIDPWVASVGQGCILHWGFVEIGLGQV